MKMVWSLAILCLAVSGAIAGPNAGGTLIVHDANLAYTSDTNSYCGLEGPSSCETADTRLDGSSSPGAVWKVYAALPCNASLKGVSFGVQYAGLSILDADYCGDFQIASAGWPGSGSHVALTWPTNQTGLLAEAYWFAGYNYSGEPQTFRVTPDPTNGGVFFDGNGGVDPIAGYGSLGFDCDGTLVCPALPGCCCTPNGTSLITTQAGCDYFWAGPCTACGPDMCSRVCCDPTTGACTVTTWSSCLEPNVWHPEWSVCEPNPCPKKKKGKVAAWGQNDFGQCTPPSDSSFVAIAGGNKHSLGLKSDGTIVAWGYNGYGQCTVPAPDTGFVGVAGGGYNSLGLKSDGTIVAWGINNYGQGNVPSPNANFTAVAGGDAHCLGLKSDGTIVAWGRNDGGQCNVPSPNANFEAISAGQHHSLGLKSDGTIVAWGSNEYGQSTVPSPNGGFVAVAAGLYHSLGLKSDGTIVAWGSNTHGERNVPTPNADFVAIDGGNGNSLGLKSDGTIVAWGWNGYGQCNVPAPNSGFGAVAAGYYHSLGLRIIEESSAVEEPAGQVASGTDMVRILSVAPNPVTASAEVLFESRESGTVWMAVHDVGGRQVSMTVLGSFAPGRHQVRWEARDTAGLKLTSGVYFVRLQGVAGGPSAQRVLLIR